MRMVRLVVEYDMDDEDKSLEDEARDWLTGQITIEDIVQATGSASVRVEPCELGLTKPVGLG